MVDSFYKIEYKGDWTPGQELPQLSTQLDSVRAYQFEVHFVGLPSQVTNAHDLTLAAKQVSQIGFTVEDIEIHRVNDRVYYPGKPSPEEVTVTFDNLYMKNTASDLWNVFTTIYDPISGEVTSNAPPGADGAGQFKVNKMEIIQLDNSMTPHSAVELYGAYPKSWKTAEFNYATNEFHTIEVTFRYDFMSQFNL